MNHHFKIETIEEWKARTGKEITKADFSKAYDRLQYKTKYIRYKGEKNKLVKVNKRGLNGEEK